MKRSALLKWIYILSGVLAVLLVVAILLPREEAQGLGDQMQSTGDSATQSTEDAQEGTEDVTEDVTGDTEAPEIIPSDTVQIDYDIHPDKIGLYIPVGDGTKDRKLITQFKAQRAAKKDIDCFEALASTEERLKGKSFSGIWKDAWDAHENTEGARIGYHISFNLTNGDTVDQLILKPSDGDTFRSYLEIYLYDDINQTPGVRYSHLEDEDMEENTILSSIKLTSGNKINQVGEIRLTAFIYNDPAQVADGVYSGDVSATVVLSK